MCSNVLIQKAAERTGINFINLDEFIICEENGVGIIIPDISQLSLYTR